MEPNVFLTEREAARILRVSTRTMQRWRLTGDGPPFVAAGGRRIYRRDALLAWADSRTFTSTSAAACRDHGV